MEFYEVPEKSYLQHRSQYLETNLRCILNVVSLSVDMQHDVAYEISQSTGQAYKIKIVAATFMNMDFLGGNFLSVF